MLDKNKAGEANIKQNLDAILEGMEALMNNEKIFGLVSLGDDIYMLWDPKEMKQSPFTMQFRMLYPRGDGTHYPDGSPRLLKSRSGVNCYGEEGKRFVVLICKALEIMKPPQKEEVRCLSIKRTSSMRITDDDSQSDSGNDDDDVTSATASPAKRKKGTPVKSLGNTRKNK